ALSPCPGTMREVCAGCDTPISDRFLLRVNERSWHEGCVKCTVCLSVCRERLWGVEGDGLGGCLKAIAPSELIMRVLENVYHVHCFYCCECERRLQRGDEFVLKEGQLLCRSDYEKEKEMLSAISPAPTESGEGPRLEPRVGNRGEPCRGQVLLRP
uniref:LIM zinc-binding domain-containing protein n=1 Tax=Bubo bubo TaxID=30461 RepID=A0A8C0EM53_BUBBB